MSCFSKLRKGFSQEEEDRPQHRHSSGLAPAVPPCASPVPSSQDDQSPRSTSTNATQSVISPTLNLSREYVQALQTESYGEIWSKIQQYQQQPHNGHQHQAVANPDQGTGPLPSTWISAAHILKPEQDAIEEALRFAADPTTTTTTLTLISSYFRSTEQACNLCILLLYSVHDARAIYGSLYDVLDLFPSDWDPKLASTPQRDFISGGLLAFVESQNPFSFSADPSSLQEMCCCFSHLGRQLELSVRRTKRKRRLLKRLRKGLGFCLIGTTTAVAVSAVAVATHALVAIVAAFLPPVNFFFFPRTRLLTPRIAQLDATAKGTFVLNNNFITIDRLVARLSSIFQNDKDLIRVVLEKACSSDSRNYLSLIHDMLKMMSKNSPLDHLNDLEEHVCICLAFLNRTRTELLREIQQQQQQQRRPTANP